MGRLGLRRNVGEIIVVESPLGKLKIKLDSSNDFGARLTFQGSEDYTIYREEAESKSLQNKGAFPVYYDWSDLLGTHWANTVGYKLYDLVSPIVKNQFDMLAKQTPTKPFPRGAVERDLKHFRIIAGSNRVVALSRHSTLVLTLGFDNSLTPTAMEGFVNSIKFEASPGFLFRYGFSEYKETKANPEFFNLMRIDVYA